MNSPRPTLSLVISALVTSLGLVGCAGQPPASSESASSIPASQPPAARALPDTWDQALQGRSIDQLIEETRQHEMTLAREGGRISPDRKLDVPLVRIVEPHEHPSVMVDCMNEQGFHAEALADGSLQFGDVPAQQGESLNYAFYTCVMSYPINPYFGLPYPKQAAEELWTYWTGEASECVREHGFDPGQPPSKEAWMEGMAQQRELWSPFTNADTDIANPARDALFTNCPRHPANFFPHIPQR